MCYQLIMQFLKEIGDVIWLLLNWGKFNKQETTPQVETFNLSDLLGESDRVFNSPDEVTVDKRNLKIESRV